jgi:hypothetical protein
MMAERIIKISGRVGFSIRASALACLSLLSVILSARDIEITYSFEEPVISRSGQYFQINFEGARPFGEPGKPTLPFYPVRLLLPPGHSAVAIEYDFKSPVELPGSYQLLPQQEYRPVSAEKQAEFQKDEGTYSSKSPFPQGLQYNVHTHFMNGHSIAVSSFTPVSYVPAYGKVTYFREVHVTIHTAPDQKAVEAMENLQYSSSSQSRIMKYCQNPGNIDAYSNRSNPSRDGEYMYLVITSDDFASELDTLISFYYDRGITARCYTLNYIDTAATGNDMQEKMRNFIIDEYQDNGIQYVLLGGDDGVVPYRGFYCYVDSGPGYSDSNIPSDIYFSALDGTWDDDGDGVWGEPGEDDLLPEVAVGRLTFGDTTELHNMLHKTMKYQSNPVITDLNQPLMAGEHLYNNPETWGSDYLRLLVGNHSDSGYVTNGIPEWHDIDTLYDRYSSWSEQRLRDSINNGHSFLHHVGHANYTYVMKMTNTDITDANFPLVNGTDANYPVIYTHGCNCGGFDYSSADCIAERMIGIANFAVSFVGNSRYGWFIEGTAEGPSQHLHREFVDALYSDSLYRIGMAHMESKAQTAPFLDMPDEYEPGAYRWCFYDCNVLGDPIMAMWSDYPHSVIVEHPPMIMIGEDTLTVIVRDGCSPLKGMVCGLYQADSLLGSTITASSGICQIPLNGAPVEGITTLKVSGYNVLLHEYIIPVADYWLGITADWHDPQNWATGQVPDQDTDVIIPEDPEGSFFPMLNSGVNSRCRNLYIMAGGGFHLGENDNLIIHGN